MARKYTVWAIIERHDDALADLPGEYEDIGAPVPIGHFDTPEEANAFVTALSTDGEGADIFTTNLDTEES